MKISELFASVDLTPAGPVPWRTPVPEPAPGVYVIGLVNAPELTCAEAKTGHLSDVLRARWLPREPVIYIGRTVRSLRHRLGQFYRHQHGQGGPHAGGQDLLLMEGVCGLWVYWAATGPRDARDVERAMLEAFSRCTGALRPFANRTGGLRINGK